MWIADMDFKSAKPIIDAIQSRAEQEIFGYTSKPGSYYEALIDWYKTRYDWNIDKKRVLHSPTVVTSLSIIIQSPVYYLFFDVIKDINT